MYTEIIYNVYRNYFLGGSELKIIIFVMLVILIYMSVHSAVTLTLGPNLLIFRK